jgi:hypothetical protein
MFIRSADKGVTGKRDISKLRTIKSRQIENSRFLGAHKHTLGNFMMKLCALACFAAASISTRVAFSFP